LFISSFRQLSAAPETLASVETFRPQQIGEILIVTQLSDGFDDEQ
jgi:hypothetical protein